MIITSKQNPLILHIKKLQIDKGYRAKNNQYILENPKNIADILATYPHLVFQIIHSIPLTLSCSAPTQEVSSQVMEHASTLKNPPGVLAIITHIAPMIPITSHPNIWVLDQVSDPSNIGAIIRNAVAFNIKAILFTAGSADPTHPKSVQASAGQVHQIACYTCTQDLWKTQIMPNFQVITLDTNASIPLSQLTQNGPTAFVFGSEGEGIVTDYILNSPRTNIYIPMTPNIDSLNVATTSGIIGYYLFKPFISLQ